MLSLPAPEATPSGQAVDSDMGPQDADGSKPAAHEASKQALGESSKPNIVAEEADGTKPAPHEASKQALGQSSKPKVAAEDQEDREEFSGFRIQKRTLPAAGWSQEVREGGENKRPRQVLSFRHLCELGRRKQDSDYIVIGILFEKVNQEFGNGETFARWSLTDLGKPEPRCLDLHLVGDAFWKWRRGDKLASATRGSIFALLNPTLIDVGTKPRSSVFALRMEKSASILKLGECPSLGLCEMKRCNKPCNADRRERFCSTHLNLAYAEKSGRSSMGGNINAHLLNLAGSKRKAPLLQKDENEPGLVDAQKRVKTMVALEFDDRRLTSHQANANYVNAIRHGARPDQNETSRVPVLGRAFNGKDDMDLDISTLDSDEKSKAMRMIEQRAEPEEEDPLFSVRRGHQGSTMKSGGNSRSTARSSASTKASSSTSSASQKSAPSLRDLVDQMRRKPVARRPGIGASSEPAARAAQAPAQAEAPRADPSALKTSDLARGQSHESPETLLQQLEAAGDSASKVKGVLKAVDALPIEVLHEGPGRKIYDAVGKLSMRSLNLEIKDATMRARRRWRARSDASLQLATPKPPESEDKSTVPPETSAMELEGGRQTTDAGPSEPDFVSFHSLDPNTIAHLLAHVTAADTCYFFQQLCITSKYFNQYVLQRRRSLSTKFCLRVKEITFRDKSATPKLEMLVHHLQGYSMLKTLDLSEYTMLPANWTKDLAQAMPSTLKNLHLRGCKMLRDASVKRLLSACPQLELLDLLGIPQLSSHALAVQLPSLRVLAVGSLGRPAIAEKQHTLRRDLTGTISTLGGGSTGSKQQAAQSSVKITSALLSRLARPPPAALDPAADHASVSAAATSPDELGGAPITHAIMLNCAEIEVLPHLPATLRHLDLRGANLQIAEKAVPSWRPLSSCERLEVLVLAGNDLLSGAALHSCIASLPAQAPLRVLDMSWTKADTGVISALISSKQLLTHLCMAGCPAVGDMELALLLQRLQMLEVLDVKRCLAITGPLSEIAERYLLPGRSAAGNAGGVASHQEPCCPNLRYLGVSETALSVDTKCTARALKAFAPKADVVTTIIDFFKGYQSLPPDLV